MKKLFKNLFKSVVLACSVALLVDFSILSFNRPAPAQGTGCYFSINTGTWEGYYPYQSSNDFAAFRVKCFCDGGWMVGQCQPIKFVSSVYGWNSVTSQFDIYLAGEVNNVQLNCHENDVWGYGYIHCLSSCLGHNRPLQVVVGVWDSAGTYLFGGRVFSLTTN